MAGNLTNMMASIFSGSAVTADPYYEYTTLLLPGSGTNGAQNNSFVDSSANAFPITRNPLTGPNAPTQGTFSPFSQTGWGNYFDGSGDYLSATGSAATQMGTGAFTWECWCYILGASSYQGFIDTRTSPSSGSATGMGLFLNTGTLTPIATTTGTILTSSINVTANSWNHVALTRSSGGTLTIWVNGSSGGTVSNSSNLTDTSIWVGGNSSSPYPAYVNGYLSNVRMTKGADLYTTPFTPSTSPLTTTVSSGTVSLLTCQSNRFIDNSTNNFTITRNADVRVVAFSPFNPTASWSAATNGGSGYFDGSGDYLSNTSDSIVPTTGDFTIEGWFYPSQVSTIQYIFGTGGVPRIDVYINSSAYVGVQTGGSYRDSSTTKIIANAWNYIAITRTGSTYAIFVNGVSQTIAGTGTMASTITNTPTYIGTYSSTTTNFTGYICGLRVSTSVRTGLTTLPTSPYTSDANTSLLLNFTNAGIYDATSKNDLETVDGAQISNTTAKWGSTSIKFDGTGDYLQAPYQTLSADFGTGQFTIELWVYFSSSVSTTQMFVSSNYNASTGAGGWAFLRRGDNNTIAFTQGANVAYGKTWSPSLNTWYHCAVTRDSSNNLRIFVDGTQVGSTDASVTASINGATSLLIGTNQSTPFPLTGYIQDLRITPGIARYTVNFPAPTAAFPTL